MAAHSSVLAWRRAWWATIYGVAQSWTRLQRLSSSSRFVIAFHARSNHLLNSWLQSPSAIILEPKERKSVTAYTFSPSICHEVMVPDTLTLVFLILSFKPAFHQVGLPLWLSWQRICMQCGRPGFDLWVGKIPWRRERLPTLVFWPGEFHGQSMGLQRVEHDWATFTFTFHQVSDFLKQKWKEVQYLGLMATSIGLPQVIRNLVWHVNSLNQNLTKQTQQIMDFTFCLFSEHTNEA